MNHGNKIIIIFASILFSAPEGGSTLSALEKILDSNYISRDMKIILMNTGTSLKYTESVKR